LCLELIQADRVYEFSQGLLELKLLVEAYLGGQARIQVLDINNKEIEF